MKTAMMTKPEEQLRVIYVVNSFEKDGPNSITAMLATAIIRQGGQVAMAAWSRSGELMDQLASSGVEVHTLGRGGLPNAWAIHKVIEDFRPQIVHFVLSRPIIGSLLVRLLPRRLPVVFIYGDHGVHEWGEKGRLLKLLMSLGMPAILRHGDAITTVSPAAKWALVRRGQHPESVRVLPNGVDMTRFYPRSKKSRKTLSALFTGETGMDLLLIGTAGNLRSVKGMDVLINAIPAIVAAVPQARFVIWGDGPELSALRDLASRLGAEGHVCFMRHSDHLETQLPSLDIYVQPSRSESFGLAAAEAMACEVPVVLANVGGLQNLVINEHSGLLFRAGSEADLARVVIMIAGRPYLRKKISKAGRLRVLQHFNSCRMIDTAMDFYHDLRRARH